MLTMLAILFILLGNFAHQTCGNGPAPLTFTIDSKLVLYKGQLDQVEIWQNGQKCGKPIKLNESNQFTVDWTECPEEVKGASDLKHIKITIQYWFGPEHERMIQRVGAKLADCSDDLLQKLFLGGEAKILVSENGRNNVIEYVADKNGNVPGTVTFTIDHSNLDKSAELVKVEVKRKEKSCAEPTIVPPTLKASKQFTVNWKECPEVNGAADLRDVEFHIQIVISGPSGPIIATPRAELKNSTDEELKQFFAGGKAKITINTNADNEVKYVVEDRNTSASHGKPGPLTFTIDSKVRSDSQLEQVEIWQNGQKCGKPINMSESTQFTVDWKECPEEVKEASDFKHIDIMLQYSFGPKHEMIMRPGVNLGECSGYLLNKLFLGGEAKILVSEGGRKVEIKYVADKNVFKRKLDGGEPPTTGLASSSTKRSKVDPKTPNASTSKEFGDPRNLTFTVNSHFVLPNGSIAKLLNAAIIQNLKKCEITIAPPNLNESKKFTIDWEDCPKKLNEFADLDDIRVDVHLEHGNHVMVFSFKLKEYSDGLLRHLFAGGEAEILVNEDGRNNVLKYVRHPNQILFAAPGLLTFTVEYEGRTVEMLREVTLEHTSKEMGGCNPTEIKEKDAQFSVDLPKCNVHDIEDLLGLNIHIKFSLQNPSNSKRSQSKTLSVPLSILKDEEPKKFYDGGHAKIMFNSKDEPTLTHIRPNPPEPSIISHMEGNFLMQHLSAFAKNLPGTSSSSHSSSKSAGTVNFTIVSQIEINQSKAQLESVEIFQNDDDDKMCEITTFVKKSQQFTVDWNNCPEKPKTAADLRKIEILVTFAYGPNLRRKSHYQFFLKDEEYSEDLLKKLFDGGEAKIVITDIGGNKHTGIEFVKNSNTNPRAEASGEEPPFKRMRLMEMEGSSAQQPSLAFNVDYEYREGAFFDQVEMRSYALEVDAANCKPLLYEGGKKFSVNLANCGVNTAKDLAHLIFEIRFLLDYAPGKQDVNTVTRFASCYGLPDEELQKFFNGGEAKLVFFDPDQQKRKEFLKRGEWKAGKENPFFALTHLSAPNKPAAPSSLLMSQRKMGFIQLFVDWEIFEAKDKQKSVIHNGRSVIVQEEMKVVDEQNMKLRKDGVECPMRISYDFGKGGRRSPAVAEFTVEWTECVPEIKDYRELNGMVLNITYQQGEKAAAKELFYTFTQNDSVYGFYKGNSLFLLKEYEHGKVKHEQDRGYNT